MSRLALHLNDAGITLSNGDQIAYREPGFAYLGDDALTTGNDAFAHARIDPRRVQHHFWSDLNTDPLSDRRFKHLSAADLASRQLEQIWNNHGQGVQSLVVAVPGYMSADKLGLFLGIARELNLPIAALVDSAVAATRREYTGAVPVHIDMGLHHVTITRLAQPGMVQTDRCEVVPGAGLNALNDAWIRTIAEAFVQQSRFDPLHTAATEQMLLNRLAGWLVQATRTDKFALQLEAGGTCYTAEIESLALIGAAAPVYQQITSTLRAFYRAEDLPAIQVTDRIARLPGLTDMLKARIGGEVFLLEPGATARGALARCRPAAESGQGVSLLRQLPWDQAAIDMSQHAASRADAGVPTHLLFGHNAYSIGNSPLVLGSQEDTGGRFLALTTAMPGVSRKHCSLTIKNGQCVLEDHSRYGTFLNGHRVDGTSILQVGDDLRVGSPGFEFQLIKTDEKRG